ncbi:hypothetical protein BN7_2714 [Wickerhamomyces ciferrii]|uniref:Transcription factor n=1 Tax=Wickerhamomyces ciferrii (strain ATCC 14091 / BCRC 22168 / CBS 111 / JCM 3599 / NBRC 0793 / NRRL Y-1031 F-60-10) TaxID=1206466 RepID=K0KLS3_WICCF|nr:uncharacterized protein BN7_2714 [Wickerhamomyces ciferrii]CCH43167.1 hypothetical protein BN7_2714 [Wickerhamomyces ciferrii]
MNDAFYTGSVGSSSNQIHAVSPNGSMNTSQDEQIQQNQQPQRPLSSGSGGSGSGSGGQGITQAIRNHLGFNDDKKWKEFSNRRLELIDKFNLSYRKASEQDDAIKQIANLLRTEFGFPQDTLMDFDKLVRAAVQSVRRNRKRSSRSRIHNDRFILNEKLQEQHELQHQNHIQNTMGVNTLLANATGSNASNTTNTTTDTTPSDSHQTSPNPTNNILQLPPIKSIPQITISPFNKNKLLQSIQKSKTCASISNNDPDLHIDNLINLGNSIISASAAFVLERFFQDLSNDSINYLYQQITSTITISKILKSLGVTTQELIILSDFQTSQLLAKLLGGIVKDFGFDSTCYDLAEIFHEVILNQYPLVATQVQKITNESLVAPTLSVIPKEADKEVTKNVQLSYGDKNLNFIFKPISTAPPTLLEILENGKIAFKIEKNTSLLSLKNFTNNEIISNDEKLEKLFKQDSSNDLKLIIEIKGNSKDLLEINSLL